jgi:hypothetical protein
MKCSKKIYVACAVAALLGLTACKSPQRRQPPVVSEPTNTVVEAACDQPGRRDENGRPIPQC